MERYMEHEIEADTKGLGFSDAKDGAKDQWWKADGLEVQFSGQHGVFAAKCRVRAHQIKTICPAEPYMDPKSNFPHP